ncbi:MAG: methylmalonyl-CoA mutase family protein [Gemmatimonadota bacterium]|nr:methylmalonyl-CoA mutase family protein [Gemmatimonadota bacterium]
MSNEAINEAKEQWEKEELGAVLKKHPERREVFKTDSGLEIPRLSTPADRPPDAYLESEGFPGRYPYLRGVQPTMYRGRLWTMRQYAGFGTADESNQRYRYLLEQGQTGLSVAFDLPTQMGYDSDHGLARGEVGRVGVAIDSLEDMERLFDRIPLDKVSVSMTINSTASVLLAMYVALARKRGFELGKLAGTLQNDILKEYVARGTYIFPPEPSLRLLTDIISYCTGNLPKFNPISISGYHIREAGSTAVQEVAFTLADAICYVERAVAAGLDVDNFARRLSFFFAAHNDFLEEIAKFRAARRVWAKIMKERFGAKHPKSCMLRFHTQTGGVTLTAQQEKNNIVRVTLQALAAVLGGAQSLHTNSFDEAMGLPAEEAVTIALRTQQIIGFESGVTRTVDPLGGSYYLEQLTDRIEEQVWEYLASIDDMGGMLKAVESGYIKSEIVDSSYDHQLKVENGSRVVVGVNRFQDDDPAASRDNLFSLDPAGETQQVKRLTDLKNRRDETRVNESLECLRTAARGSGNLVQPILEAVENLATIGEICGVLREEFGTYSGSGSV